MESCLFLWLVILNLNGEHGGIKTPLDCIFAWSWFGESSLKLICSVAENRRGRENYLVVISAHNVCFYELFDNILLRECRFIFNYYRFDNLIFVPCYLLFIIFSHTDAKIIPENRLNNINSYVTIWFITK